MLNHFHTGYLYYFFTYCLLYEKISWYRQNQYNDLFNTQCFDSPWIVFIRGVSVNYMQIRLTLALSNILNVAFSLWNFGFMSAKLFSRELLPVAFTFSFSKELDPSIHWSRTLPEGWPCFHFRTSLFLFLLESVFSNSFFLGWWYPHFQNLFCVLCCDGDMPLHHFSL